MEEDYQKPKKYQQELNDISLRFKEPRPDGGVEEFRKCRPAIDRFAKDIERSLRVSRKSLEREINI